MELLDKANIGTYGAPVPTRVRALTHIHTERCYQPMDILNSRNIHI